MTMQETQPEDARDGAYEKVVATSMGLMKDLAAVMDQETDLLGKGDSAAMTAVRAEKAKLIRDYRTNMTIIIQNPDLLQSLASTLRAQLKQVGEVLAAATKRNVESLKTAVDATQALVSTIMTAARRQSKTHDSYADPRKKCVEKTAYGSVNVPVAVNRTA